MRDMEFFRHVQQFDLRWHGRSVRVPVFYYDLSFIRADFSVPADGARALLPSPRMHPWRVWPGHSVLTVAAMEYRDSGIGPYNEVLIGVPFTMDAPSPMFTGTLRHLPEQPFVYIHRLPVTTQVALDLGIEFLAAPKFLAEIGFEERDGWVRCRVAERGVPILTLSVRAGPLAPAPRSRVSFVTARGGDLLRWDTIMGEHGSHLSRHGGDAAIEFGPHPLGEELRQVGVGRALMSIASPRCQMSLSLVQESWRG